MQGAPHPDSHSAFGLSLTCSSLRLAFGLRPLCSWRFRQRRSLRPALATAVLLPQGHAPIPNRFRPSAAQILQSRIRPSASALGDSLLALGLSALSDSLSASGLSTVGDSPPSVAGELHATRPSASLYNIPLSTSPSRLAFGLRLLSFCGLAICLRPHGSWR